jgi:hypothetical protein
VGVDAVVWCRANRVFRLVNGIGNELPGMPVGKAVVDLGSLLVCGDHPSEPHLGQVLGNGG